MNKKSLVDFFWRVVLGFTFKENCPDIRNTRVIDIVEELRDFDLGVDIYDPNASAAEVREEYGLELSATFNSSDYQAVILAVSHREFRDLNWDEIRENVEVIYDIKGFLEKDWVSSRL